LPRSTISDKLNAKSLPDWDFVVSFVTACRAFAERNGMVLPTALLDMASWDAQHLRLLRAVDSAHADGRLVAAARVEIGRRDAGAAPMQRTDIPVSDGTSHRMVALRQLPPAVRHFVGRKEEVRILDRLMTERSGTAASVLISTVHGMAGVGKTALAVHWAHRVADEFPDGQLYVNLRGFDSTGPPKTPTEALRELLNAFGVPAWRIPASLDAQAGLYRSLLNGRRVLVVLDNARDDQQVRPLLPGSPGCLVLVASRNQLTSLICHEDALPVNLDLLSVREARELLTRRLGRDRVAVEPDAAGAVEGPPV
jgi:hypothetical protein